MFGGLVTVLAGHLIETAKLKAYALAVLAGAGVCLLFAFVLALVALRHWIAITYSSQYPELWIALAFVIVGAVLGGVALYINSRKAKGNPAADIALIAGPPVLKLAARNVNARVGVLGALLIAGLMIGRRLTKRSSSSS